MPIVLPDQSGLAEGIMTAGQALGQALQLRGERQAESTKLSNLDQILASARFDKPEDRTDFLRRWIAAKGDVKEGLAIIKQSQPSRLQEFFGVELPTGQQVAGGTLDTNIQMPDGGKGSRKPIHPAIRGTPYSHIPDDHLALGAADENKEVSDFSKYVGEQRNQAYKRYNQDREYASKKSKAYTDKITKERSGVGAQKIALRDMRFAVENRDKKTGTMDWWASMIGPFGEPLVSKEGALLQSGVKAYLIDDLAQIKGGRANQYLEKQIVESLPSLSKTNLANEALLLSFEQRQAIKEAEIDMKDKLSEYYDDPDVLGFEPANIERIVHEQLKPVVEELESEHAYKLRQLEERDKGIENLINKKVGPDTPLTLEMMTALADKYGLEKAYQMAIKLGYTVPTKAEYERYKK